jgi:hypothetical protein
VEENREPQNDKLKQAQAAFMEFYSICFWFMRPDLTVTESDIPYIIERLRADGGRPGFKRAAELCR